MFTKKKNKAPVSGRKKFVLIAVICVVAILLTVLTIGYFSVSSKLHKILPGNPIDAITKNEPLKSVNGRTNFLIFGTSYDDPNPKHTGGYLTDSLIIVSIDNNTKKAYTISIPRDLWVDYNTTCNLGKSGKINATYLCALNAYGKSEKEKASQLLVDNISQLSGLQIQYYIEVNYTFIRSLTDALEGIDVDIYSADARGIYDPTVGLKLPSGNNHLDGKTALKLARARNSEGGYGLPRSNFDREINQQRIINAIFKKLSASGSINNVDGALKLIDALSGEVRTNVQTKELKSAIATAQSLKTNSFTSIPLVDYLTTGTLNGQSIVYPVAGLSEYSTIQQYISEKINTGDTR